MNATTRPVVGHFTQLDALRGIAALTVVLNHFTIIDPLRWMWRTPLRFLLTGHDAVILFFIISGFVLTLQLTSSRKPGYTDYILKRICRIYLPFVAVFSLAYTVMWLVYEGPVPWAGVWANRSWDGSFSASDVVSHLVFLGRYRADHVIPVIWTLIYEMRISLFFPVLVFFVVRLRASHSIAAAMIISAGAYLLLFLEGKDPYNANLKVEWELTVHFTGIFVVGAVLAVHRTRWQQWLGTPIRRAVVLMASLGFYFFSRVILNFAPGGLADFLFDWGVAVGASGIICTSLVSGRITSILAWRPIVFLGAISYSLYLTHTVLLLSLIHLMPSPDTAWIALALAALLVFPVATLAYFLVERPSMAIGRALILRRQASDGRLFRRFGEPMTTHLKVSICLPTCNRPELIVQCIDSCLAQTYANIEIVIGDDSKDERTRRLIAERYQHDSRVRYLKNEPSLGQARNVASLFARASGDRILLIHDDDYLVDNGIERLLLPWQTYPDLDVVFADQYEVDAKGHVDRAASDRLNADFYRTKQAEGLQIPPGRTGLIQMFPNNGWLADARLVKQISYEEQYGMSCDYVFGAKLCLAAKQVYYRNEYVSYYRKTAVSVSANTRGSMAAASVGAYAFLAGLKLDPALEPARRTALRRIVPIVVSVHAKNGSPLSGFRIALGHPFAYKHGFSLRLYYHLMLLARAALKAGPRRMGGAS